MNDDSDSINNQDNEEYSDRATKTWIFWIFGTPVQARSQIITKCLVSKQSVQFEGMPSYLIRLTTIKSCRYSKMYVGYNSSMLVTMKIEPPHPRLGPTVRLVLIDPLSPIWASGNPHEGEFRSFVQLIQQLQAEGTSPINANPYVRAFESRGLSINDKQIKNADTPPVLIQRPNTFLVVSLICFFCIVGLIVLMYYYR